jgi:hypothetical protein
MDEDQLVDGLSIKTWKAMFRPGMHEYAATIFTFSGEAPNLVRVAFGNGGPHVNASGPREPVYTHAVTLTPELAVDLAGVLLKHFAKPDDKKV